MMAHAAPDEYVYYNGFIGGVEGAAGLFKLDYWANSYAEAVGGLEDYLRAEYGADFMDHDFTVAVCGPPISAGLLLPGEFHLHRQTAQNAEFFIAFTKDNCNKALPGKEIYRVERMGTLLSVVLDRRDDPGASAATARRRRRAATSAMERSEYERLAAAEERMWWFRGLHANLVAALARRDAPHAARSVLDAGCGTGGLPRCASRSALPDATLIGIDARRRRRRRWRGARAGAPVVRRLGRRAALRRSARSTPSSAPTCCAIAASTRRAALAGFRRCLKPGGAARAQPAGLSLAALARMTPPSTMSRRYGRGALRGLLAAAGFADIRSALLEQHPLSAHGAAAQAVGDGGGRPRSDVALLPAAGRAPLRRRHARSRAGCFGAGVRLPFGGSILATAVRP